MIESFDMYLALVERGSEADRLQLRHDEAPESVWMEVLERRPDLAEAVTSNKRLPDGVLRLLANSKDDRIRTQVAAKRRIPEDVREMLSLDPEETVRARVAWNAKTPKRLLEILARDSSPVVSEGALKRLSEV